MAWAHSTSSDSSNSQLSALGSVPTGSVGRQAGRAAGLAHHLENSAEPAARTARRTPSDRRRYSGRCRRRRWQSSGPPRCRLPFQNKCCCRYRRRSATAGNSNCRFGDGDWANPEPVTPSGFATGTIPGLAERSVRSSSDSRRSGLAHRLVRAAGGASAHGPSEAEAFFASWGIFWRPTHFAFLVSLAELRATAAATTGLWTPLPRGAAHPRRRPHWRVKEPPTDCPYSRG